MDIPGSPWRVSLGGMPVTERRVDKQPSVAITIQIEYSYFSGTNLSFFFFFFWHSGAVFHSVRILTIHPIHPRLLIQRWAVRFGFWREARTVDGSQRDAVRKECRVNSGGALGSDALETQCLSSTLPPGSICLAQVLLHTESPVKQTRGQWSALYLTSTGFYICPEITQLKEFSFWRLEWTKNDAYLQPVTKVVVSSVDEYQNISTNTYIESCIAK